MNRMLAPVPSTGPDLHTRLKTRIRREWMISTTALLLLTFCLSYFSDSIGLTGLNNTFYDRIVALLIQDSASDEIMIIAIDDASIEELGYWPWRRAKHAELLGSLSSARAVAFDLVFGAPNPAYPDDDRILARAIQDHGRVVLPIIINRDQRTITPPLPILASATPYLGTINIYPDTDGVIRSASAQNQLNGKVVNHLSVAMLEAGNDTQAQARLRAKGTTPQRIAYAQFDRSMAVVPYHRVLDGSIPPSRFDGKYVLVGAWDAGLGDTFATPYSSIQGVMPGVEVLANLLNSALNDRWVQQPERLTLALFSLIPVLLCCIASRYLSPQRSFLLSLVTVLSIFVMAGIMLAYTLWWLSPVAALAGTALVYPVWSWRSQQAALRHIDVQMAILRDEGLIQTRLEDEINDEQNHGGFRTLQDRTLLARIRQLHQAIDSIRIAQQQRNETMRFLSHDMRAPLNSILALSALQRNHKTAVQSDEELLTQFDNYANKTLDLVDGFISLSHAEVVELSMHPINLSELIMQARDGVWALARQKQIQIELDDLPDAAWTRGDGSLLERVWTNLLDNALKYSPSNTRIHCSLYRDGDEWVSQIRDEGRGMDPISLESAFSPFVRLNENSPDNPSGIGLGLAFVRTAIARHGGRITVESEPGNGSCFTIRLAALDDD